MNLSEVLASLKWQRVVAVLAAFEAWKRSEALFCIINL